MADGPEKSVGDGDDAESKAAKAAGSETSGTDGEAPKTAAAADHRLPVVWSPKLDIEAAAEPAIADEPLDFDAAAAMAGDDDAIYDEPSEAAEEPAAAAPRSSRFALLAATIALAAATGSFVGTLTGAGLLRVTTPRATGIISTADTGALQQALQSQLAELSALKASLDGAARGANTQFAKIADRLDRVEHAETDPSAKLAQIVDALGRLDQRTAAAEDVTGSIGTAAPPAPAAAKLADRILDGWIVQDVRGGRALVASRNGAIFDVGAGSVLPGLGHVVEVRRQDGQWVVLTDRGLITSR